MAEVVEKEEEEIWEEVEEVLAAWISPMHLFRAKILSNPLNSFRISSECPSRQEWLLSRTWGLGMRRKWVCTKESNAQLAIDRWLRLCTPQITKFYLGSLC